VFQKLVSHNKDLRRLVEEGFAVAFDSNHLVVRDIPYFDDKLQLKWGAFVTKLEFINENEVTQQNHQVFFTGSDPYELDGTPVRGLGTSPAQLPLSEACKDLVVQRAFSCKPVKGQKYDDFFHKIDTYVARISGPAMHKCNANPHTFRSVETVSPDLVFKFQDTMTSLAGIGDLSAKFRHDVVAVIGAGGTGAYLLDFLAKAAVREVRAFDGDRFHVHNAFRSPGKTEAEEFGKNKAELYASRYANFRTGFAFAPKFIDATCADDLTGVTFAFVCVDKGAARAEIFELLLNMKIPFIDVGMGLRRKQNGSLNGMLRITYYSVEKGAHVRDLGLADLRDNPNDEYRTNIQISELNALNASLAIIKFKQLRGFYFEEAPLFNILFEVADLKIASSERETQDH
jgi:hypothetical protein